MVIGQSSKCQNSKMLSAEAEPNVQPNRLGEVFGIDWTSAHLYYVFVCVQYVFILCIVLICDHSKYAPA